MLRSVVEFIIGGVIACGLLLIGKIAPHFSLNATTAYGVFLAAAFLTIVHHLFGDRR